MNETLDALSEEGFRDAIKAASKYEDQWQYFLEPEIIDRTQDTLKTLIAELMIQKTSPRAEEDKAWARGVGRLMQRLQGRAGVVNRIIKEMNREETATLNAQEHKWSTFAYQLAEALDDSDNAEALQEIILPSLGGGTSINAHNWLIRRREQQAMKTLRRELANV